MSKVPDSVVEVVRQLGAGGIDPVAIATKVGLSRLQVRALLAEQNRLQSAPAIADDTNDVTEGTEAPDFSDLIEDVPSPVSQDRLETAGREDNAPDEAQDRNDMPIGQDRFDEPVVWRPSNPARVHNPHLMIMGESGTGKTYAVQCLIAELAQRKIPSIVFDYGQSFEIEKLDPLFIRYANPKQHLIGEEGLSLNPFQITENDKKGPNGVAARLADVFAAAFGLGDIQAKVLIHAVLKAYRDVGVVPEDRSTWSATPPSFARLQVAIDDLSADRHYANRQSAVGLSARLTTFFMLASFTEGAEWSWDDLLNDSHTFVHVLQFRGVEGKTQRVLVELLLWHMFFHLKVSGQNALRLYCVLDEAHHLSFRDMAPINLLLREARKFGIGIIFASQQPEDFSPVAYSNTASKLIFRTYEPTLKVAKLLAGTSSNYSSADEIHDTISRLERGRAFFISENRGAAVHVADLPTRSTRWGRDD